MSDVSRPSRVVVFGGTGRTGRLIVDEALRDGHVVTVAAREPDAVSPSLPNGVAVLRADMTDEASVALAMTGQDAAIVAVSTPARRPRGLYSASARSIVSGAAVSGVKRVVVISSGGVRRDDPALPVWYRRILIPVFMGELYADMADMESIIRRSDLDWTIVRASYLTDRPTRRGYRVADGRTPSRGWKLARPDLARFAADQLRTSQWRHLLPTLAE